MTGRRWPASSAEIAFLKTIQRRLVLWFLAALVALDLFLLSLTYGVLDYRLGQNAHNAIVDTWRHYAPSLAVTLAFHDRPSPVPTKKGVATWVIPKTGAAIPGSPLEDIAAPSANMLPIPAWASLLPHRHTPLWTVEILGNTRILVGGLPLWYDGRYVGALESRYSLGGRDDLLEDLLRADMEIGAVALVIMWGVAYWLAGRALKPIRQSLTRQRHFVHDVSHEIRTPLTILKSSLELAQDEEDPELLQKTLHESLQEIDYLTRLMDDLATLARIESGVTPVALERFSLTTLVHDVAYRITPTAQAAGIHLTVTTPEPIAIWGDPVRLRQLLFILLDNGVKYNRPGGTLSVVLGSDPKGVNITVSDTGRGIPQEDLPHVFDRFYRSRHASRLSPGSGLGLAIAAWIVQAHHGRITVQSRLGEGTTFSVHLPHLVSR